MITIQVLNGPEVEAKLAGVARRMAHPEPAFELVSKELEAGERSIFESYGGKYVDTGALRASLTSDGGGAIRELTPSGLKFGSDVPYAKYQGTTGKGRHRLPSAILKLTPAESEMAGRTVMEFIVHGGVRP